MRQRGETQENLWVHTLDPLNMPIKIWLRNLNNSFWLDRHSWASKPLASTRVCLHAMNCDWFCPGFISKWNNGITSDSNSRCQHNPNLTWFTQKTKFSGTVYCTWTGPLYSFFTIFLRPLSVHNHYGFRSTLFAALR